MDQSRFEQIVGDVEAFRIMLDGAFKGWKGTYEVLLADTGNYLFGVKEEENFSPFCGLLHSKSKGEALCLQNDRDVAEQLLKTPQQTTFYYTCHAGLIDVAIPIRVDGELVATIFFGGVRSTSQSFNDHFFNRVRQLEQQTGFADGELTALAEAIPQVTEEDLHATIQRVEQFVAYMSRLGADRLKLIEAQHKDQQRFKAIQILQTYNHSLNDLSMSWDEFWNISARLLDEIGEIVGALAGLILVPGRDKRRGHHIIAATAGLPDDTFRGTAYQLDAEMLRLIPQLDKARVIVDAKEPNLAYGPVRKRITQEAPQISSQIKKEVLLPMLLEGEQNGLITFYFAQEGEHVPSDKALLNAETNIMLQLAGNIANAFNNRRYFYKSQRQTEFRREWLETVTHQFVAPLSGVVGHAQLLARRLERWEKDNPNLYTNWDPRQVEQLRNALASIERTSQYASQLASNFSRTVYRRHDADMEHEFVVADDLIRELVQVARDFQGYAESRGLRGIEVNTDNLTVLNRRVRIIQDDNLFRQAVGNLIDNAIKYSARGTTIMIDGFIEGEWGVIQVINEGIQLPEGEEEKIFEYEYRTYEARMANAPGTGIGLSVTRDIIKQHKGTLTARPSVPAGSIDGQQIWRTTFSIRLPLVDSERN